MVPNLVMALYRLGDTGPAVAEIRARLAFLGLLACGDDELGGASFETAVFDRASSSSRQVCGPTMPSTLAPRCC